MDSSRSIIAFLYAHESHPPLLYLVAHVMALVGLAPMAAMSALLLAASVATIVAAWWLASLSGLRWAGLCAGLTVGGSMPLIIYSVQLRPYSLVSLLLLTSVAALVQGHRTGARTWKAVWAASLLLLLYIHHLGILIAAAEVAAAALVGIRRGVLRAWGGWWFAVVLLSVPDALLAVHQSRIAGYPVAVALDLFRPIRQFVALCWAYPAELLVPTVAVIALVWRWARTPRTAQADPYFGLLGMTLLGLLLLLVMAAYRSGLLVTHVLLAVAPLGGVVAGVVVADCFARGRRVAGIVWIEALLTAGAVGVLWGIGFAKTNIDITGGYINAEAGARDLILVAPGAIGPTLGRGLSRPLSQINYPIAGGVRVFPFDHEFTRMSASLPLTATLDSLTAVCNRGSRVWFVSPAPWRLSHNAPAVLTAAGFGGSIQSSWARASYLHEALLARFGPPKRMSLADSTSRGMEMVRWELFGLPDTVTGAALPLRCQQP
jgi:hypothetical protein